MGGQAVRTVEVFLSVKVEVDDEFSLVEHVTDIVEAAKKVFPTADIAAVAPDLKITGSDSGQDHPFG